MDDDTRYSTIGPVCPYCEHEEAPDEAFYYSEDTDSLQCGNCGEDYAVEVYNSTSWKTMRALPSGEPSSPTRSLIE